MEDESPDTSPNDTDPGSDDGVETPAEETESPPPEIDNDATIPGIIPRELEKEEEKYTLEIDGKPEEFSRSELVEYLKTAKQTKELTRGAHKQFQDAAELRKKMEAYRANPRLLLEDPEFGEKLWAEMVGELQKEHDEASLTPEQKRIRELEDKLEAEESSKTKRREDEEAEKLTVAQKEYMGQFEFDAVTALEHIPLPQTPDTIADIARQVWLAAEANYDLPTKRAVELTWDAFQAKVRNSASRMNGKQLMHLLGDENLAKIRQEDVARVKALEKPAPVVAPVTNGRANVSASSRKPKKDYPSLSDL